MFGKVSSLRICCMTPCHHWAFWKNPRWRQRWPPCILNWLLTLYMTYTDTYFTKIIGINHLITFHCICNIIYTIIYENYFFSIFNDKKLLPKLECYVNLINISFLKCFLCGKFPFYIRIVIWSFFIFKTLHYAKKQHLINSRWPPRWPLLLTF